MQVAYLVFWMYLESVSEGWNSSDPNTDIYIVDAFVEASLNLQSMQRNSHVIRAVFKSLEGS